MTSTHLFQNTEIIFNKKGFPIFEEKYFAKDFPEDVVPFNLRKNKVVENKNKTVLCFYQPDKLIYARFCKLFNDINEYKKYYAVISPDITVTKDMDIEWQNYIMLANQLFIAILAVNGIKIIINIRNGVEDTLQNFISIPKNITVASGFLGCKKTEYLSDATEYLQKIFTILPNKLIIYGKDDKSLSIYLNRLGIDYKRFTDFHSRRC